MTSLRFGGSIIYPERALTNLYQFRFSKLKTLKINLSQFDGSILSRDRLGLRALGQTMTTKTPVSEFAGKGELEKWCSHNPRLGALCGTSILEQVIQPVEWTEERSLVTPSSSGSSLLFIMSAIPIWQRACWPLPKYLVVPLSSQFLTLSLLEPTIFSIS